MCYAKTLDMLLKKSNGFLKTADVTKAGISRPYLGTFVKRRGLERVAQGLYRLPDAWDDDMHVLQVRYPEAVFSHETALYLLGLAEREPLHYSLTLPTGKNSAVLNKQGIKVYKIRSVLFATGLIEASTPAGHTVRTYNAERTVCDLFRSRRHIERQDLQAAMKNYLRKRDKNIPALLRMAKLFSMEKVLRQYLEAAL